MPVCLPVDLVPTSSLHGRLFFLSRNSVRSCATYWSRRPTSSLSVRRWPSAATSTDKWVVPAVRSRAETMYSPRLVFGFFFLCPLVLRSRRTVQKWRSSPRHQLRVYGRFRGPWILQLGVVDQTSDIKSQMASPHYLAPRQSRVKTNHSSLRVLWYGLKARMF